MKIHVDKHIAGEILLFFFLGYFSLFVISQLTEVASRISEGSFGPEFLMAAVVLHVGMGAGILYAERRINREYRKLSDNKWNVVCFAFFTAVLVFFINYLIFSFAKLLIDFPEPFSLKWSGVKALLIIWMVEVIIISQLLLNNFYRHLMQLQERYKELQQNEADSRYQALQQQLSPHFLFNSLNTLVSEMQYDVDGAVRFTERLSDVYRYILDCQECRKVSLESELEFFESYVYLQNVRLGDCIVVRSDFDDSVMEASLPPLTLQVLAENIVKHNVVSRTHPMTVVLYTEDDNRWFCVSNPVRQKEVVSTKTGLKNLSMRYRLLSGKDIKVVSNPDSFIVKVPLLYE